MFGGITVSDAQRLKEFHRQLKKLVAEHKRQAYRRLHGQLIHDGYAINHKRTERIYREERLMLRVRRRQFKILNGMDSCICDYRCVEINTSIPGLVCGAQDRMVWMNGKSEMITTTSSPGNGRKSTRRSGRTADQAA
jgi:putative transposase